MIDRRRFLRDTSLFSAALLTSGSARAADDSWSGGKIRHLIPLVSDDRILLKVSFAEPQERPALRLGRAVFSGRPQDTMGRFWAFAATDLDSDQEYELSLTDSNGSRFADPWPLNTSPAQTARAERLRVLIFTCAGGPDGARAADGRWQFLPVETRRRLLKHALSFNPDLAIGVGDNVYWDQTINARRRRPAEAARLERIYGKYGSFDEDLPVLGSANELTLTSCMDEQLALLYGTDFRSTPLILTQDDHDYFENDEASDELITFPPRNFSSQLARATQQLYFPEYLPDSRRPTYLAGSRPDGLSESYGSFKWGSLLELLLYDCRRFLILKGPNAVFVEEQAERWLAARTANESGALHLVHVPSVPFGWSAGKWGEWYPDFLQPSGELGTVVPKPYWQSGWFAQHQRILSMLANQDARIPLIVSGDLHAIGSGVITASADLHFDNPINTVLSGPVSTGLGWPSASRGIGATAPADLEIEARTAPIENNGFTLLDFDPDGIEVSQFAWDQASGVEAIDDLQAFATFRLAR